MTDLHIRDARAGDQAAIRAVTLEAYQEYAAFMQTGWEAYRQNIEATLTDVTPAEQIVAEQAGKIVGSVLLIPAGTLVTPPNNEPVRLAWPEIRLLAVTPAMRGHGIGRALVDECLRRARHTGAEAITLHTTDMMQAAMSMYEHMGFVRTPETDFHPRPDVTVKGYRYRFDDQPPTSA